MNLHVINRPRKLNTTEASAVLRVRPQTLRRALCLKGEYLGLRPEKLPNGRLLWDAAALDRLTNPQGRRAGK